MCFLQKEGKRVKTGRLRLGLHCRTKSVRWGVLILVRKNVCRKWGEFVMKEFENCCGWYWWWRYNRDNQEKPRRIRAFGGLTQLSNPDFYAERVRRRQKAKIVDGFLTALFDPILKSMKIWIGGLEQACAWYESAGDGLVVVLIFGADEIRFSIDRVSWAVKKKLIWEWNFGRENMVGSGARMGNNTKKLRSCMFGDGDIIGTTKKYHDN